MARKKKLKRKEPPRFSLWQKCAIGVLLIILFGFSLFFYGHYLEPKNIKVKEIKISSEFLPTDYHGLKIIHLSDIHYNTAITKKELSIIVKKVNSLKPDIVVLTGDLLDKRTTYKEKDFTDLSNELLKIDALIGKYAVTGNHDTKFTEWETVVKNSGFTNLNERYELLYKDSYTPILIAGSSSNLQDTKNIQDKLKPTLDYMKQVDPKTEGSYQYAILLLHEPDYLDQVTDQTFNLILSGHSHQGQVKLPIIGAIITPPGAEKYRREHYVVNQSELYISNGLGTSTYQFRLFNPPAIYFYRLTN